MNNLQNFDLKIKGASLGKFLDFLQVNLSQVMFNY
jgi:hypothetical protein